MAALRYVLASSLLILTACGEVKRADDAPDSGGSDAGGGGSAGTAGYATYHKNPCPDPAPSDLVRDGLCMAEFERTSADDPFGDLTLPPG
jgi:hypothetical protein